MPVTRLVYTEAELLRSHPYERAHWEAGRRLHGGFDAQDRYIPPRLLVRGPAIDAWTGQLRTRGGDLLRAGSSLLSGVQYPSVGQSKLLVQKGLGQTFWNTLTITGRIEARGRILAETTFPDLQDVIEEDVSEMAVGHLNRGLLRAHGLDEGGEPEKGIGGHDVMWFALRDLAFGETDYPEPTVPENIGRPAKDVAAITGISAPYASTIDFLLNLLMIEFRAERGFSATENLLRDSDLFVERRAEAGQAAEIVNRIRADEEIHVLSLRLYLGELRSLTFKTERGERRSGSQVIDPLWDAIVRWATVEQPRLQAEQQRDLLKQRILAHPDAERIMEEFLALEER
jgi:hypothetical protein